MSRGAGPPPFARILVPVDPLAPSNLALTRARNLMVEPGTHVTLLGVGQGHDHLDGIASVLSDEGIEVDVRSREGSPAREIVREIEDGHHDLVVLTCRRRSALGRTVTGDIAFKVLRRSPVPVLFFRPLKGLNESFFAVERSQPAEFRRILLMLDGSKEAERIMEPATRLARAFGSEMILFRTLEPGTFGNGSVEAARAYLDAKAQEINARGIATRLHIAVGDPAAGALKALDGDADTIAFTTRGRSPWSVMTLGSVAPRLLRRAEGPVLCLSMRTWGADEPFHPEKSHGHCAQDRDPAPALVPS